MKAAIIGGDKRMLYAAKAFSDSGIKASVSCFDRLYSDGSVAVENMDTALRSCDFAVLPPIPVIDGMINAPFSKEKVRFSALIKLLGEKPLFCGMSERLECCEGAAFDYMKRESFLMKNARITAEGAVFSAMKAYEGAIEKSRTLVSGCGRIGRALCGMLASLSADVTVLLRSEKDRLWAQRSGLKIGDFSFSEKRTYDLIFNTVPALVFKKSALDSLEGDPLIFDLASKPGGVDFEYAAEKGLFAFSLLSLPGKYAPASAGRVIKETIMEIWEENR